jgi:hypothetical protein
MAGLQPVHVLPGCTPLISVCDTGVFHARAKEAARVAKEKLRQTHPDTFEWPQCFATKSLSQTPNSMPGDHPSRELEIVD